MRNQGYSQVRRRPKPWLIALIVLGHLVGFYLLARALVPDITDAVERDLGSALTVVVTAPDEEEPEAPAPEPEPEPAPEEGEQGAPGKKAVPKPEKAPEPKVKLPPKKPAPKASSTGDANRSGARDEGEGTGAAGTGDGTGSGDRGTGTGNGTGGRGGGFPVTKPEHISGGIDNARDYPVPEGGRKVRRGTRVVVKVTVGTDGRASNCSVYRASPDAEADQITCQLVTQRLRFKPAQDANGDPVAAPFYWQQKWF